MIDKEIIAVFHYDDKGSKRCGGEPYRYAEEIIRCKECKYMDIYVDIDDGEYFCRIHTDDVRADDFCSYGEREGE